MKRWEVVDANPGGDSDIRVVDRDAPPWSEDAPICGSFVIAVYDIRDAADRVAEYLQQRMA